MENQFAWYYTEWGQRQDLQYFKTEQEAVVFAFEQITTDRNANRHLVCVINDKKTEFEVLKALNNRNVPCWTDANSNNSILVKGNKVFLAGCEINRIIDLRNKYGMGY